MSQKPKGEAKKTVTGPVQSQRIGGQHQQQRLPTIDEQVSSLLGAFNRTNNRAALEAENAVIQVIAQLVGLKEQYDKLMVEHQSLKDELKKINDKKGKK